MNQMIKKISVAFISAIMGMVVAMPLQVAAQGDAPCELSFTGGINCVQDKVVTGSGIVDGETKLSTIMSRVILWLMAFAAVLALGALIFGGISFILSVGDEKKAESAKKIILYAIVGLLVIGISFVIIRTVQTVLTGA